MQDSFLFSLTALLSLFLLVSTSSSFDPYDFYEDKVLDLLDSIKNAPIVDNVSPDHLDSKSITISEFRDYFNAIEQVKFVPDTSMLRDIHRAILVQPECVRQLTLSDYHLFNLRTKNRVMKACHHLELMDPQVLKAIFIDQVDSTGDPTIIFLIPENQLLSKVWLTDRYVLYYTLCTITIFERKIFPSKLSEYVLQAEFIELSSELTIQKLVNSIIWRQAAEVYFFWVHSITVRTNGTSYSLEEELEISNNLSKKSAIEAKYVQLVEQMGKINLESLIDPEAHKYARTLFANANFECMDIFLPYAIAERNYYQRQLKVLQNQNLALLINFMKYSVNTFESDLLANTPKTTYEESLKFVRSLMSIAAPPVPVLNNTGRYSDENFKAFITSGQGDIENYINDKNFYLIKASIVLGTDNFSFSSIMLDASPHSSKWEYSSVVKSSDWALLIPLVQRNSIFDTNYDSKILKIFSPKISGNHSGKSSLYPSTLTSSSFLRPFRTIGTCYLFNLNNAIFDKLASKSELSSDEKLFLESYLRFLQNKAFQESYSPCRVPSVKYLEDDGKASITVDAGGPTRGALSDFLKLFTVWNDPITRVGKGKTFLFRIGLAPEYYQFLAYLIGRHLQEGLRMPIMPAPELLDFLVSKNKIRDVDWESLYPDLIEVSEPTKLLYNDLSHKEILIMDFDGNLSYQKGQCPSLQDEYYELSNDERDYVKETYCDKLVQMHLDLIDACAEAFRTHFTKYFNQESFKVETDGEKLIIIKKIYSNLAQFEDLDMGLLAKYFENERIYSTSAKLVRIIKSDGSLHPAYSILPDLIRELGQANPKFGEGLLLMAYNTRSLPAGGYDALDIKVEYSTNSSRNNVFYSCTCFKIIYLPKNNGQLPNENNPIPYELFKRMLLLAAEDALVGKLELL